MHILTVAELSTYLRELLESDEVLRDIWVEGEISNFTSAASGHCYFNLKDNDAVINVVMWRSFATQLPALPRNGDAVLAHGRVSFYTSNGRLQIYVDALRAAGVGLLHARFEELKTRLTAEGLFDPSRKRPLPTLPRRVGVVTSARGAALRDIITVINRRCPLVEVVVASCLVQGEQAPESIVAALNALYATDVDVIIVARGGGSIEDLWAFNEEIVARALFAASVPLITGVGHETDTTMVDYVADVRAPTPSAAAELAVPERGELAEALAGMRQQLDAALAIIVETRRAQLAGTTDSVRRYDPTLRIAQARQHIDDLVQRAGARVDYTMSLRRVQLQGLSAQLTALSPQATLERGYAVVRRRLDGVVVTQAAQVVIGGEVDIMLQSGQLVANITAQIADEPSEHGDPASRV